MILIINKTTKKFHFQDKLYGDLQVDEVAILNYTIPSDIGIYVVNDTNDGLIIDVVLETKATIAYFTAETDKYIQAKITAYNEANGVAFSDINTFPKYAMNSNSVHYVVANQFITWVDLIWIEVRALTVAPSDTEFKTLLDTVAF